MAAERASLGSFLFTAPAASLGCTSSTSSPAATSSWASGCPSPPAPSTAQVRSGQACAQASSRSACAAEARTRTCPAEPHPRRPPPPCAILCAGPRRSSPPRPAPSLPSRQMGPRRACLITDRSLSHLLRATPRQGPAGRHVVRKPDHEPVSSGYESQPCRTSERYDLSRNACTDSSIRRISRDGRDQRSSRCATSVPEGERTERRFAWLDNRARPIARRARRTQLWTLHIRGRKAVPLQFSLRPGNPVGQPLMMPPPDRRRVFPRAPPPAAGIGVPDPARQPGPVGVSEDGEAATGHRTRRRGHATWPSTSIVLAAPVRSASMRLGPRLEDHDRGLG
jgi:hypothetical protein